MSYKLGTYPTSDFIHALKLPQAGLILPENSRVNKDWITSSTLSLHLWGCGSFLDTPCSRSLLSTSSCVRFKSFSSVIAFSPYFYSFMLASTNLQYKRRSNDTSQCNEWFIHWLGALPFVGSWCQFPVPEANKPYDTTKRRHSIQH